MTAPSDHLTKRPDEALQWLGPALPGGLLLLDTNAVMAALIGRGPAVMRGLLAGLQMLHLSAPTVAEMRFLSGRLDPNHRDTAHVLAKLDEFLDQIPPERVLVRDREDWNLAAVHAGRIARAQAGATRTLTSDERVELLNDALTGRVAVREGMTVLTADRHFDLLQQLEPALNVVFYR